MLVYMKAKIDETVEAQVEGCDEIDVSHTLRISTATQSWRIMVRCKVSGPR
jgi:hypothetical protein